MPEFYWNVSGMFHFSSSPKSVLMASILYTAIVDEIRGRVNGSVFSKNANGAFIMSRSNPTNPQTEAQQAVRAQFTELTRSWKELDDGQREQWKAKAADEWPYQNRLGLTRHYTGFQLYQKLNMQLLTIGQPTLTVAPSPANFTVSAPTLLTATVDAGGVLTSLQFDTADDLPDSSDRTLVLSASSGISAGRNCSRIRNPDCFMRKVASTGYTDPTDSRDLTADYSALFADPAPGTAVWIHAWVVDNATGTRIDVGAIKAIVTQAGP